jgi:hypothetical protein
MGRDVNRVHMESHFSSRPSEAVTYIDEWERPTLFYIDAINCVGVRNVFLSTKGFAGIKIIATSSDEP